MSVITAIIEQAENPTPCRAAENRSWQTNDVSLLVYPYNRGGERTAGFGVYYDTATKTADSGTKGRYRKTAQGGRRRGSARERLSIGRT
jgi:hypothetical protein